MKVLVTGKYEPDYNRIVVLLDGLRKLGVELIEYRYEILNKETKSELKRLSKQVDLTFLPSFTYRNVKEVKKISEAPVAFDPLISMYMTKIFDYKSVFRYSPRALKNYLKDYFSFRYPDLLFADTQAHKNYFAEKFNIPKSKIYVLPVGVNTTEFTPLDREENSILKVGFYGSFAPLQGIDNIIKAAILLKNEAIDWEIIGDGFDFNKVEKLAKNHNLERVYLRGRYPYSKLNEAINSFDISLGIFGTTIKSDVVVPNKIYHYAACGQAIITKDTPAIREVFTPNKDVLLIDEKPESIAEAILQLKQNTELRNQLRKNARLLMDEHYSSTKIAEVFIEAASKLVHK